MEAVGKCCAEETTTVGVEPHFIKWAGTARMSHHSRHGDMRGGNATGDGYAGDGATGLCLASDSDVHVHTSIAGRGLDFKRI